MAKLTKHSKTDAYISSGKHPDHQDHIARLRRAHGQVDAIERMILNKEYCPKIIQQLRAATAALKALEANILKTHLEHCVKDALNSKNKSESDRKITELINLFKSGNK